MGGANNIGFGCMRLSRVEPLLAALEAGVTLLDTAHAYAGNEALVAEALQKWHGPRPHLVSKGGLTPAFENDARAKSLRAQCEQSVATLGRIDTYLLHAPDPSVALSTSVRALAKLKEDGHVAAIGLSNVSLPQLREAMELAPISAVQVALGAFHDGPFRDGVVAWCLKHGITVLAHTPLGGVKRAAKLSKDATLKRLAERHGVSAQRLVLSWLADLGIVALPGARRVETARDVVPVKLDDADRAALDERFTAAARVIRPRPRAVSDGEIVLIMGLPGAGKSTHVQTWVERGYERLNRDDRGGTLRGLALELDVRLKAGARRLVLDNTYLTRASRNQVLEIADAHGVPVRGLWLDTPAEQAQVNIVERSRDGEVLPASFFRMVRQLELPEADEGFAQLERVPFQRKSSRTRAGLVVALESVEQVTEWTAPALVIAWRPSTKSPLSGVRGQSEPVVAIEGTQLPPGVELAVCPHDAGPPTCWCRPPLPGLAIAWARKHDVDLSRSRFVGESPAFKTLARVLTS